MNDASRITDQVMTWRLSWIDKSAQMLPTGSQGVTATIMVQQTGPEFVLASDYDALKASLTAGERDAARWRYVRQFLSVDDIDGWQVTMAGHMPDEVENLRADAAADRAILAKGEAKPEPVPLWPSDSDRWGDPN